MVAHFFYPRRSLFVPEAVGSARTMRRGLAAPSGLGQFGQSMCLIAFSIATRQRSRAALFRFSL
jgi:hypothetical protein